MAGRIGVDPGPFTWHELQAMDKAGLTDRWDYAAAIVATVQNVNRKRGTRPLTVEAVNPYRKKAKKKPVSREEGKRALRRMFPNAIKRICPASGKGRDRNEPNEEAADEAAGGLEADTV